MTILYGIDLGGTKVEGVVVDSARPNDALIRQRIDTEAELGYEHILSRIAAVAAALDLHNGGSPLIGVGHPGTTDPQSGLLKNSNTTCLNGRPLKADLERILGRSVFTANDANCFALAESAWGAARGSKTAFGIIMGTGVGGGVVANGSVLHGCQGIAGEWGHNVLVPGGDLCYCGKRGCVETVISGPAVERFYARQAGTPRRLSEIAARQQIDEAARETIDRLTSYFAEALAVVINILDPQTVVLGGGVSNVAELYTDGVRKLHGRVFNDRVETKVIRNALGDSAGVFGAALLSAQEHSLWLRQ